MKKILVIMTLVVSFSCYAATDTGVISQLYVDQNGNVGLQLDNGFPNAVSAGDCPSNNGFAGITVSNNILKSALLSAKATQSSVTLSFSGCTNNGNWLNVFSVYVH